MSRQGTFSLAGGVIDWLCGLVDQDFNAATSGASFMFLRTAGCKNEVVPHIWQYRVFSCEALLHCIGCDRVASGKVMHHDAVSGGQGRRRTAHRPKEAA